MDQQPPSPPEDERVELPPPTTIREALRQLALKFLSSRKWVATGLILLAAFVAFLCGQVTRDEMKQLLIWLGVPTIVATGIEGRFMKRKGT